MTAALLLLALLGTGSAVDSADAEPGHAPVVDITVTSGSR